MISLSEPLSVKQLSDILQGCFSNPAFSNISVYGEVYSIKLGKFSYIEIGDQGNKQTSSPIIKCAFSTFYSNPYHLEEIKTGDIIQVTGSLSYYAHGCSITLWGKNVQVLQTQLGKNLLLKQKTLKKLDSLGYLNPERKREIPKYVKKVAVLTASSGAAYQDILKTLHMRFPVSSVLYPIVVQGNQAAGSIVKAMKKANESDCDVILLGRGGGSKTDLSCFDDEKVALSIATSQKPVITCIGHTIDTSIADRVSDKMAITPTEGASLINPSKEETIQRRMDFVHELDQIFIRKLEEKRSNLEMFSRQLESLSPMNKLSKEKEKIRSFIKNLNVIYLSKISQSKTELEKWIVNQKDVYNRKLLSYKAKFISFDSEIEKFNPKWIQEQGFAIVFQDGKKITSASQIKNGNVTITYPDGKKTAKVE